MEGTGERIMKRLFNSIRFKSIFGVELLLVTFFLVVSVIGYQGFTEALLDQYAEDAFRTAKVAALNLEPDRVNAYMQSGGENDEYQKILKALERVCNASGSTFVYVIKPDLTDYKHIQFIFSTEGWNYHYDLYDFGYIRETTNEEYEKKYRALCEGSSSQELVVRDRGYIETDPHITAMVPLRGSDHQTKAILCVQRQMKGMTESRKSYVQKLSFVLLLLTMFMVIGVGIFLNKLLLQPIKDITEEADRFANENKVADVKLTDTIRNKDEIGRLAGSIDRMEEEIVNYVKDITRITGERERITTELSLARRIQADMLPSDFPAFPDRKEFDIYASMTPAREVGGDFYDFILMDEDHLYLTIADVSGKGVPAALFMMASQIVLANMVMMGYSPGEVLERTNEAICANNKEEMFVTVWLAILEISTGRLTAANAGHEYPAIRYPDGDFALLKDKHGLVIGGMEGVQYKEYELVLEPGSRIFVYTDGVPEATDASEKMFGTDRMLCALNRDHEAGPEQLLANVRNSVDAFVNDAEQFDDLTMLCLEYKGPSAAEDFGAEDGIDR